MGLAILPARLKKELSDLADAVTEGADIRTDEVLSKHADWVDEKILPRISEGASSEDVLAVIKEEVGVAFSEILECAGVYKQDEKGLEAFERFISSL